MRVLSVLSTHNLQAIKPQFYCCTTSCLLTSPSDSQFPIPFNSIQFHPIPSNSIQSTYPGPTSWRALSHPFSRVWCWWAAWDTSWSTPLSDVSKARVARDLFIYLTPIQPIRPPPEPPTTLTNTTLQLTHQHTN
jgi:hypothetical protein